MMDTADIDHMYEIVSEWEQIQCGVFYTWNFKFAFFFKSVQLVSDTSVIVYMEDELCGVNVGLRVTSKRFLLKINYKQCLVVHLRYIFTI